MTLAFSLGSCAEKDFSIDRDVRRAIDTLFRNETAALKTETDSICEVFKGEHRRFWLDSVIHQRQVERDKILINRR